MVPALEKAGMLTVLDETAMVNYVVAYDRFRQAQGVIQEHGFTTHTAAGGQRHLQTGPEQVTAELVSPQNLHHLRVHRWAALRFSNVKQHRRVIATR